MRARILSHPLFAAFFNLKGNQKVCVYTEPLWGIPFNLFTPYATLYMAALGLSDRSIGIVASVNMAFQIVFALLSGIITDKLGRKRTTFIFDTLSWSGACLIWAISQNFNYFLVAAMINGMARITMNSWSLILVEDCPEDDLVNVYAWIHIANFAAGFFAPLTGLIIHVFGLVPSMRAIYALGFIMMTAKFLIFNRFATETEQGKVRLQETKHDSILTLFRQYRGVLAAMLRTPQTLLALGIMMVMTITQLININFWPLLVTERLNIPVAWVGIFPFVRSAVMLTLYFLVAPRLSTKHFRNPMLLGFLMFIASQTLLITAPFQGFGLILISILLEAASLSLIDPLISSILVIAVDFRERARIMALIHTSVILFTSPFGWVAGTLSEIQRIFPFLINISLFVIGAALTVILAAQLKEEEPGIKVEV